MDTQINSSVLRACQVEAGALTALKSVTDAICRDTGLSKSEAIAELSKAGFRIHRVANRLYVVGLTTEAVSK